jgi:hypothetical protein
MPVKLKDGSVVYYPADTYLDARRRDVAVFRAAEAADRVRVQREAGDLRELLVVVAPERLAVARR